MPDSSHFCRRLSAQVLRAAPRWSLVFLPAVVLSVASVRAPEGHILLLALGAGLEIASALLALRSRPEPNRPLGPYVIALYVTALTCLWFGDSLDDWYNHLAKAVLIVIPLLVFGHQALHESGAAALRRANRLAERLASRQDWPSDLARCKTLPEVKALRAALAFDAGPALALLKHPRHEVLVAALTALEFRKEWRLGQAEIILHFARRAELPAVRAAAVMALGNVDDRTLVEMLAQFLHDHSREVRLAAAEALLWDPERRWGWIRYPLKRVLGEPLFSNDGPLLASGVAFPPEAVNDLTAWCAEKGVLSTRSAQTLGAHFNRALTESADDLLVRTLRAQLANPQTPAVLRLELGRLLQQHGELDHALLEGMFDSGNPAPLRLIAAETILTRHADDALRLPAISALRDLARLPNREIALSAADLVQRRLGVDLGLGVGQPLPATHTRQAADVVRRAIGWALQYADEDDMEQTGVGRRVPVQPGRE